MGFSPKEMIQLVACGHTIGGAQSVPFPNVVPESAITHKNPNGNKIFDQTFDVFDNHMYVSTPDRALGVSSDSLSSALSHTLLDSPSTRS